MTSVVLKIAILGAACVVVVAGALEGYRDVVAAAADDVAVVGGEAGTADVPASGQSVVLEPVEELVVERSSSGGMVGVRADPVRLETRAEALAHVVDTLPPGISVEASAVRLITLRGLDEFNGCITDWVWCGASPDDGVWLVAVVFKERLSTDAVALLPVRASARGVVLGIDPRDGWRWTFTFMEDDLGLYHAVEAMEDTATEIPPPFPSGSRPPIGGSP
jgi:hypothetical protein